ncbi:BatD family protein [bacterium]|nr:BatD family protein [bacterium]
MRNSKISILILSIFIFSTNLLLGDDITLSASVDKSEITIGDKITYSLKIVRGKDIKVDLPSPGSNLGQFDILDFKEKTPIEEGGKVTQVIEYVISSYAVGDYKIPPVKIAYNNKKGESQELTTDEIPISVKSVVKPEEKDIHDIKDVAEIPLDLSLYYKIGGGVLFLGMVIALLIYYIRYRRQRKFEISEESLTKYPPHEEAFMSLKALEEKNLIEEGMIKEFYIEFSEIIRIYVGRRYNLDALEQTTYELLENLKEIMTDKEHIDLLSEILDESDFVKYAKYRPEKDVINSTLQKGYDFVEKTKKIELFDVPQPQIQTALKE